MYFKAGLYVTYMIEAQIGKGLLKEGIYEDNYLPYHYFRVDPQGKYDRIIAGGEDHRQDIPVSSEKSFKALEKYLASVLGSKNYKIRRRWTGPILEPIDGLPYVGRYKKNSNILVTHGFSGTGMTFGTISALIFSDTVRGVKNEWEGLLDTSRLPTIKQLLAKGKDYSEEFVGGAVKNTFAA
jgi:glycine/D-amino acid oxidase-like deaminating enzyme